MKFEIIMAGCGAISWRWLEYLSQRDDAHIAAIVETDRSRAEAAKSKYGLDCNIWQTLEEAFQAEQANVVFDLTYVTVHEQIVTKAMRAGYDVIGEKPMALTLESVRNIMRVAEETGRRYTVMQNRRYIEQVQQMRRIIDTGLMGGCVMINGEIFVAADMGSIRNQLEFPQLQDNNIHIFDQARYICGGKPISVYYYSFNPKGSKYSGDAAGIAVYEMDNGCVFSFRGYNDAEGMHTSWDHNWRVCCERGTMLWDGFGDVVGQYTDRVGTYQYHDFVLKAPQTVVDQHALALKDMLDNYARGERNMTDCHDNIYSIAMVLGAVKSIKEKRKIAIHVTDKEPYLILE